MCSTIAMNRNTVLNTNDCSIASKACMCLKGYATDQYLPYFVPQLKTRSSLINRGYYVRFKAIEFAFNYCLPFELVISLGCGFDTSSLRFKRIRFIEIDFGFVAISKAKILITNQLIDEQIIECFENNNSISDEPFIALRTNNYCLIGADLKKSKQIVELIGKHNLLHNICVESRICLLNECSLCYMKQTDSDHLIKQLCLAIRHKSDSITYIGYEQIKTHANQTNGFENLMRNHFEKIGSPLLTFLTPTQQINRFNLLDFYYAHVLLMSTFYEHFIDEIEKKRIETLDVFDEYEEFDLLCSCYALTIASTDHKLAKINFSFNSIFSDFNKSLSSNKYEEVNELALNRFGHTTCLTNQNEIVLFGGFGCETSKMQKTVHKRLSKLIKINSITDNILCFLSDECSGRLHSRLVELKENLLLLSGGRHSPSKILDNQLLILLPNNTYKTEPFICLGNNPPNVYRHLLFKMINSNKIIQFGGKTSDIQTDVNNGLYYELDINTYRWQKRHILNMYSNIHTFSGVSLNSNVFVYNGGLKSDTNSYYSSDVFLIDDRINKANIFHINGLNPLYSHNIKYISEDKILIIGGISRNGVENNVNLIDLRCNQITNSFELNENQLMLCNFSSEIIPNNQSSVLWIIGGGGNCFSFGTLFNNTFKMNLFD